MNMPRRFADEVLGGKRRPLSRRRPGISCDAVSEKTTGVAAVILTRTTTTRIEEEDEDLRDER